MASGPTAPELILPSEWLPVIWGGEEQFGKRGEDATLLLIYNAWHDLVHFKLPSVSEQHWKLVIDTNISIEKSTRSRVLLPRRPMP